MVYCSVLNPVSIFSCALPESVGWVLLTCLRLIQTK